MAFTSELTYFKFLQKINKNNTQYNTECDRPRFVLLINEAKHVWAKSSIKGDKGSVLIEHVQDLVKDVVLTSPTPKEEYTEFDFKEEYYETIGGFCQAKKGKCKQIIRLREVKNQDKQLLYFDSSNQPSFEYEWSYYTIQDNKIRIYKKDFNVLSATIEFYQLIPEFDIEGYTKIDGSSSTNIPFQLSDDHVDEIINVAALDFQRINENQLGFQVSKERVSSDNK